MNWESLVGKTGTCKVNNEPRRDRLGELDALRGLAAFGVMVFHYTTLYGINIGHTNPPSFEFPEGDYSVYLFFMISGFVIFMTLENARAASDFIVSRFSRLYPAYWASVAVTAAFVYSMGLKGQQIEPWELLVNLTMFQQAFHVRHLDGAYWTLQIEMYFYIQILFWFKLRQLPRIRWIVLLWLLVSVVFEVSDRRGTPLSWTLAQFLMVQHIPFFAMGIQFYRIYKERSRAILDHFLIGLALVTIWFVRGPTFALVAVFCAVVFLLFVYRKAKWLNNPVFAFLGLISYSLYLIHESIGFIVIWHLEHDCGLSSTLSIVVAALVSLVLATLLAKVVERPSMRWIRKQWLLCQRQTIAKELTN